MIDWRQTDSIHIRCLACGAAGSAPLVAAAAHLDAAPEPTRFARCPRCGSLVQDGATSAFEHIVGRDRTTFLRQYLETLAGPWEMFWPVGVLADAAQRSLLEVGCGFGWAVDLWHAQINADAHGCDPADYAGVGRTVLGEHIHQARLDEVTALAGRRFDVVYASEVIEHVADPHAFVQTLARRLGPRGVLVLTTPAAEFIAPENDPATVLSALSPGFHAVLFSRAALDGLLRAFGFGHVLVERHHERLIAWASAEPIERRPLEALLPLYLRYLAQRGQAIAGEERVRQSFLAGLAYRDFKERLLRGLTDGLDAARERANRLALVIDEAPAATPDALLAVLRDTASGRTPFAQHFRFCLPQMAFLNGIDAQRQGRGDLARGWFDLMQAATERLCAQGVHHNLEAATWYWIAERERLIALVAAADEAGLAEGLARFAQALDTPLPAIGGSSPSAQAVFDLLVLLADGNREAEYGRFLGRVAARLASEPGAVSAWAAALLNLSAHRLTGAATEASLERCVQAVSALSERTGALQALAKGRLEIDRQRAATRSFASSAWKQAVTTSRWG